ncbi:hypothetical protein DL546_000916 [Coniochaeta pulveracea]|uniref:Uncharacterized protein n=1 Tax=Coniochaeta pulveracea TaxID=177199 RepID=A0A420Y0H4_9PEZI|nr:hypothetical protein DL546_000916 [Coniochaeta pulveracea]
MSRSYSSSEYSAAKTMTYDLPYSGAGGGGGGGGGAGAGAGAGVPTADAGGGQTGGLQAPNVEVFRRPGPILDVKS